MKTLAFYASARRKGNTLDLLHGFLEALDQEAEIIDAYRTKDIAPCIDCRYCWSSPGCSIKDGMQEIYRKTAEADLIVFASPVYFHSVPGPLKIIIDRMQTFWAGRLRGDKPKNPTKKGILLLTGGAPSFPDQFTGAELVLKGVLKDAGAELSGIVTAHTTDSIPVSSCPEVLQSARKLAEVVQKQILSNC